MENFHIANQPLDMAYANPATLARWQLPGWVHDYEAWWNVDDARGELYDGVRAVADHRRQALRSALLRLDPRLDGGQHGRPR